MAGTNQSEFCSDEREWAQAMFGASELGDVRRTRRSVDVAARQAANPSGSTNETCQGDDAAAEAAYRFLRNDAVKPKSLEEAPFAHNAALCANVAVVLAIQDTTALAYGHSVADELGDLGGGRGFLVHSTLAVNGETQDVIGLLDQDRWLRPDERPKKRQRRKIPYKQRESYKWERASQRLAARLETMDHVIQVGDREADIFEYIEQRTKNQERFVVRAVHDRQLSTNKGRLWEYMSNRRVIGKYDVMVEQRGAQPSKFDQNIRPARKAHTVRMEMRKARVRLLSPTEPKSSIPVTAVYVREYEPSDPNKVLEWMLLTSEPASNKRETRTIIGHYECRWLIEEFHKAWKSGCNIEKRRLQAPDNLERISVITAHVAVRLLQLRCLTQKDPEQPCNILLGEDEWQCLDATTRTKHTRFKSPPTIQWALHAIAKLGGWRDTKRSGKIGWMALWKGWIRFRERLIAWRIAKQAG